MADLTLRDLTKNQGTMDRDFSKIFVFQNNFRNVTFLNDTGADLELKGGELLGVIASSGKAVLLDDPGATDGSQFPVGFANSCGTVLDGEELTISMCIGGDVVENKVILTGGVSLDDVISLRTLRDRIASDTMGVRLVESTELTNFDN
ncbi:MAG: hypothetical protein S4CHLAM20_04100 [Chlamydiia bacterium]|nr:hypothetical protein [Chlamydiia bacterium]